MTKKIAIITGASRLKGIGRACCVQLAKQGFDIFFTYWTPYDRSMEWGIADNEPEIILTELRNIGVRCEKLELDLSNPSSHDQLMDAVKKQLGAPDVLINNAAFSTSGGIAEITAEQLDAHYTVNVRAMTMLTVEFIKRFKAPEGGRIVNLTSGQSLGPMVQEIAYALTKETAITLTKTLYQEAAKKGITINTVNPGPNDTGWMGDKLKQELIRHCPMGRVGLPEDTAKLIGFLCSDDASWITGQVINSEGGYSR